MIIKIARSGRNINSTDPNDFIFHSAYNTFKILEEGTLTSQTVDADPKIFSTTYTGKSSVTAIAFAKFPDGYVALPKEIPHSGEQERYFDVEIEPSGNNSIVYFKFYKGATANYSVDIKYYIFEAPIL